MAVVRPARPFGGGLPLASGGAPFGVRARLLSALGVLGVAFVGFDTTNRPVAVSVTALPGCGAGRPLQCGTER